MHDKRTREKACKQAVPLYVHHTPNVTLLATVMGTCPSSVACPRDDGCTYFSFFQSFTRLQVNCATDFYGGDYNIGRVRCTGMNFDRT